METNRLNMLKQLLKKDWELVRTETYLALALALTTNLAVIVFNIEKAALLYVFTFIAPFFVPIFSAVQLLKKEWTDGTVYLLMSLPVNGLPIFLSKLLVVLFEFVVQTAGTIGITFVFADAFQITGELGPKVIFDFAYGTGTIPLTALTYSVIIGFFAILTSTIFLSQSLSKLVKKHQGLVAFVLFLALFWVAGRIGTDLVGSLLSGFDGVLISPNAQPFVSVTPDSAITVTSPSIIATYWRTGATILAVEFAISFVYLLATSCIFDKKLEITSV